MNVSRTFNISVAFYGKTATFTDFEIIPFFEKSHHFLGKKWTFWEIVIFAEKSHPTTILLSLSMLKNSSFFWKTSSSFSIKIDFGTFWEIFFHFCRILRQRCKIRHIFLIWKQFFQKPICVSRNPKIWTFWEVLQIQSLSTGSLLHLAVYNTFIAVLDQPILFSGKQLIFWKLWEVLLIW